MLVKKASVSAIDTGGSRSISCTVGDCASDDCGTLLRCRASTFVSSSAKDERRPDASGNVWVEFLRPDVEGCDLSEILSNRPALVGRVLPGLRFGASNRLIFGWRSQFGLRITFGWDSVGFGGGGLPESSVALVPEGGGGCGAAGWEGIGAGEEGAENRDDGESRPLLAPPRVGVAGYEVLNDANKHAKERG
jgi:hypothetical protein